MTLRTYINNLDKMIKETPEAENMEVIYSSDEEGNSHFKVLYAPIVSQVYDMSKHYLEIVGSYKRDENIVLKNCNAVCIN